MGASGFASGLVCLSFGLRLDGRVCLRLGLGLFVPWVAPCLTRPFFLGLVCLSFGLRLDGRVFLRLGLDAELLL